MLALIAITGCVSGSDVEPHDAGESAVDDGGGELDAGGECDPFAPRPEPIALDTLFAAGAAQDGTIYVVAGTRVNETFVYHLFVSEGAELVRQRLDEQSSISEGPSSIDLRLFDHDPPLRLFVWMHADSETTLHLSFDVHSESLPPADGAELTPVSADELDELTLRNFPGHVITEHSGQLLDGRIIVVTRPLDDWDYEDFRVYFGPRDRVSERLVYSASRDSRTVIEFDLDGRHAEAEFHSDVFDGPRPRDTLVIGDEFLELKPLAPSEEETIFECLP